ncbi:Uncharacterized protein FWK35_00022449, partial [Aphis craccivora]
ALGSDVLERLVKNGLAGKKQSFSSELKQFSVTLQYYSPKAYTYTRKVFNNLLPGPRTLRRWYMVVDGNPGFTAEAFEAISKQAKENIVCCNLVIDEMSQYAYDNDNIPLAKNALVFLAVGINGYWKMPIAYFLIDGLNGKERSNLLMKAIDLLNETGVKLCSITFDGASVNTKMCTELGVHFDIDYPEAYIVDDRKEKVYVFYNPAHMLKLIRNAWNNKTIILNSKEEEINWNEVMNVRLAAQTLSDSVADALNYLTKCNDRFLKASPTSKFIKYINNAFDILNSRSKFSKKSYSKAISDETINQFIDFMNSFIQYIKGLKFQNGVKDILTYKISQDHIETTFSAIRSRLGYNNNPTCRQFKAAYKRILVHNDIVGSQFGNCTLLDNTKNLTVDSSVKEKELVFKLNETWVKNSHILDHDYFDSYINITKFIEDTSEYIAGFVVKKILKQITCSTCQASLTVSSNNCNSLISIKNRGSLIIPSNNVVKVCQETESIIRSHPCPDQESFLDSHQD